MTLALAYMFAAACLVLVIRDGGPAWLNTFVLLAVWNGFKFLWIEPISVVLLARAQLLESGLIKKPVSRRVSVSRSH
jgi:hypothetical protein